MTGEIEREYKFSVPDDFAMPRLDDLVFRVVDGGDVDIDATYWDTANLALQRAHIGVRRRLGDGWTFKGPSTVEDGAVIREEQRWIDSETMPPALTKRLEPYVNGATVEPIARLTSKRHRTFLYAVADVRLLEFDDDVVTVWDGAHEKLRFRELEVEVVGPAAPALVAAVVERVGAAGGTAHTTPKIARAVAALGR